MMQAEGGGDAAAMRTTTMNGGWKPTVARTRSAERTAAVKAPTPRNAT